MSFGQRGGYGNRGGFGRGSGSFNKPVEVGKEYNVSISDTSKRGEGIARIEGFVVFVPGTRQGQNVRIRVTQVSERFASGQVVQSSEPTATSTSQSTAKTTN
ncbi:MAG: TRAM domain-containing protein [Thaumarchaeota archaeon]|nr:MAG: TRAM domain-containing protein [Nitrososphaerota archaeon]TLY16075.1 MAG: TRAM domain-containing protein [Nitrososphaerota archaeon]TMP98476.1 MAG: TRAM domain-containing protein [Nitrososphaerota archaeon]